MRSQVISSMTRDGLQFPGPGSLGNVDSGSPTTRLGKSWVGRSSYLSHEVLRELLLFTRAKALMTGPSMMLVPVRTLHHSKCWEATNLQGREKEVNLPLASPGMASNSTITVMETAEKVPTRISVKKHENG